MRHTIVVDFEYPHPIKPLDWFIIEKKLKQALEDVLLSDNPYREAPEKSTLNISVKGVLELTTDPKGSY